MEMSELQNRLIPPSRSGEIPKRSFPSWDALLADFAQIIRDNGLYPGVMPMEGEPFEEIVKGRMPSWDALLIDLAEIIGEDGMYPEEMPLESFDII